MGRGGARGYLEDVWSGLFHHVCEAEQVKQGFPHEALPLAVAPQRLADLCLVRFSRHLQAHRQRDITRYT